MSKLPRVSGQQVVAALERLGFQVRRQHGSRIINEAGQSNCADRCPRASRTGPGHLAGHSAADGHRGGGLHSIALSGRAGACAFLAVLSPPPLLPTSPPCQPCLTLSGTFTSGGQVMSLVPFWGTGSRPGKAPCRPFFQPPRVWGAHVPLAAIGCGRKQTG